MDRKTIYVALALRLNRDPTLDELRAEVKRIIAEGSAQGRQSKEAPNLPPRRRQTDQHP